MLQKAAAYVAFTRPHTMAGTWLSTAALCGPNARVMPFAMVSTLAANAFITQTNQLCDVEIDLVNKAHLPLPSSRLNLLEATAATSFALVVALLAAAPCLYTMWKRRKRQGRDQLLTDEIIDPDSMELGAVSEPDHAQEKAA